LVEEATDDGQLANNIDEITGHYAETPSLVEAAADSVAETLGIRPFSMEICDRDRDFVDPMISLDVDTGVVLTKNPTVNAAILSHATSTNGITKNGQERLINQWGDAVGSDRLREFKADREPDALGFTLPEQVPATGDDPETTPITEIPYIGPARAEDMHPTGDLMSIADLAALTKRQQAWIEFPVDPSEFDSDRSVAALKALVSHLPPDGFDALGFALNMHDHRDNDETLRWVDHSYVLGLNATRWAQSKHNLARVTDTESREEDVLVTTAAGHDVPFSSEYWTALECCAEATDSPVMVGPEGPGAVSLSEDWEIVAAPRDTE
jgi:hypothetical protein